VHQGTAYEGESGSGVLRSVGNGDEAARAIPFSEFGRNAIGMLSARERI